MQVENDTLAKIPAKAIVEGDIRLTPWYAPQEVKEGALAFMQKLDVSQLLSLVRVATTWQMWLVQ